ncbi:hypothetical protein DEI91_14815 [Curtobacterium sp. MCBD17_032]|nr:hypothetical protein DEI91_14815 [Curtobacterium sp. MCBD17_032]
MKKQITLTAVGVGLVTCLVCQPIAATAASTPTYAVPSSSDRAARSHGLSSVEWGALARQAEAVGDTAGASASRAMAARSTSTATASGGERNIWSTLAKKALLQVLRYGINKVPAAIRPYVSKIIGVVEDLEQFQQAAVVTALVHAGVPADVAAATAHWIVVFLGL